LAAGAKVGKVKAGQAVSGHMCTAEHATDAEKTTGIEPCPTAFSCCSPCVLCTASHPLYV